MGDKEWEKLTDSIKKFLDAKKKFPVQRGKVFKGFPVHFSTPEHESIRTYLMNDGPTPSGLDYRSFIERPEEDIVYTIECKIFPLLGGVLSVWLYIGIQENQRRRRRFEAAGPRRDRVGIALTCRAFAVHSGK